MTLTSFSVPDGQSGSRGQFQPLPSSCTMSPPFPAPTGLLVTEDTVFDAFQLAAYVHIPAHLTEKG